MGLSVVYQDNSIISEVAAGYDQSSRGTERYLRADFIPGLNVVVISAGGFEERGIVRWASGHWERTIPVAAAARIAHARRREPPN